MAAAADDGFREGPPRATAAGKARLSNDESAAVPPGKNFGPQSVADLDPRSKGKPPLESPRYDPRLLESFLAVAEDRHFGRAAARMAFAQPALSQQIRRLETQLGVSLFTRDAHSVQLTAAGAAFYQGALQSVWAAIDAATDAVSAANGLFGSIAIAVGPHALPITRSRFADFTEDHPDVELQFFTAGYSLCLKALHQRAVDAAVLWSAEGPPLGFEQTSAPVADYDLVVRFLRSHRLAAQPRVSLEELRDERLIMFPRRAAPAEYDHLVGLFGGPKRSGGVEQITHRWPDTPAETARALDARSFTLGSGDVDDGNEQLGIVSRQIVPATVASRLWLLWREAPPESVHAFAAFVGGGRLESAPPTLLRAAE
jgi:DNA-binding transcriptional LysR family regulator